MNQIKLLFTKRMFLVTLIILVLYIINLPNGINRTISWNQLDLFVFYLKLYFVFVLTFYVICYSLIALIKRHTSFKISILHTLILLFSVLIIHSNNNEIILLINIVSLIVFAMNIRYTLNLKNIKPKK